MEGVSDSTRQATVTEKVTDGAQVSGYRHASREVRVRAILTAQGDDALELGMTWLRNALEPDACGMHGGSCGSSDLAFFASCPPRRHAYTEYTDWVETGVNYALDPNASTTQYADVSSNGTETVTTGFKGFRSAIRFTRTATGSARLAVNAAIPPSTPITVTMSVRASVALTNVTPSLRSDISSATGQSSASPIDIPAGESQITFTATSPTDGSTGAGAGVALTFSTGAVGSTLDITGIAIVAGTTSQGYFDGDTVGGALLRYSWLNPVVQGFGHGPFGHTPFGHGPAILGQSRREERVALSLEETVEEYLARVQPLRRFLHTVTCVSGPLVQEKFVSSDRMHVGYLIEFTLVAATPAVYGATQEISVPLSVPSVVQDIPYNLVLNPSAEVQASTIVVSRNYSPNPSVEVNTSSWSNRSTVVTGTSPTPYLSFARTTELAAESSASYRGVLAGNGSTAITNARSTIDVVQTAPISGLVANTRMSFSLWAAAILTAGNAGTTINSIGVYAEWMNGATVLSTSTIDTTTTATDFNGKVYSAKSLAVPASATDVRLYARFDVTWSSSSTSANNTELRMYADSVAITVP